MKTRKNEAVNTNRIDVRVSDDIISDLKYMANKTGKTRSDIVREALKLYKNIVKNM